MGRGLPQSWGQRDAGPESASRAFTLSFILHGRSGGGFFVLVGFGRLDLPTQLAGVLSIEGLLDGGGDAAGVLRVIAEHFRPRDRLQHGPVTARQSRRMRAPRTRGRACGAWRQGYGPSADTGKSFVNVSTNTLRRNAQETALSDALHYQGHAVVPCIPTRRRSRSHTGASVQRKASVSTPSSMRPLSSKS